MTQLSALPVLSVQIAFNPTNIQSTTQTWTDVTAYVRDFQTKTGKQHYLDRIQASTVSLTLSNRNGYFLNGTTNGTGAVISQRLPIKITATYSSTTYNVFYGIIDSIEEKIGDYLNSDLAITASDYVKYMSLQTLADLNFWGINAITTPGDVQNWYQPGQSPRTITNATVTGNIGGGSTIVFTCANSFSVGDTVLVQGLTSPTGFTAYNVNGIYTITAVSSISFTATNAFGGFSPSFTIRYASGTVGYDYIYDSLGSGLYAQYEYKAGSPIVQPQIGYLNNGVLIYSTSTAVDLTAGTGAPSSSFAVPGGVGGVNSGIEFWFSGQNIFGQNMLYDNNANLIVAVNSDGTIGTSPNVSDGFWHHLAINGNTSELLIDGVVVGTGYFAASVGYVIGGAGGFGAFTLSAYIDQVLVYSSSVTTTNIKNRYLAGSILQVKGKSSADRIAEVLVLAGFGSITSGAYSVPGYAVGNSYQTYTSWTPGFVTGVTVEPYYWDNPVTTSSALDLILQVSDTDIGVFYQKADGTFVFLDQNYFGGWTFTKSTSSVSVGTGSKTFTVASGLGFTAGGGVIISGVGVQMNGTVTSYSGTTLIVSITATYGSGTQQSWNIGSWKLNASIAPSGNYQWTDNGTNIAYYGSTTQILRDDADLWTTVQVNPQAGTLQQFNNLIAEPRYGYSTLSKSATVNASLSAALSSAYYLGYLYQAPLARVGSVELRAETNNGSTIPAILGTNIYDAINFQRSSPGASTAGSVNSNMVVESISHNFQADPGQWHASFVLDPYPVRT